MIKNKSFKSWFLFLLVLNSTWTLPAQTPIKTVLEKLNSFQETSTPASNIAIAGIVSARATLPSGAILAFLTEAGQPGFPIVVESSAHAKGALLIPRNAISATGRLGMGPLGFPAILLKPDSIKVEGTNRPFGQSELRGADFFRDASSLAGRFVQLTNVTFVDRRFDKPGIARVRSAAGEDIELIVGASIAGLTTPEGAVNVFGVPIRADQRWQLLASRFISANAKATQNLAMKHTCFTCHNPDTKMVGPAYRDVAARYRKDPEAVAKLILQMETGGGGKWGPVPMVPFKGKVPPQDMKLLADWIMGYKWDALLAD